MITDPSRLLVGFTFTPDFLQPRDRCYVTGCPSDAVVGRRHRLYGCVDACQRHDPEYVGYARPFHEIVAPAPAQRAVEATSQSSTPMSKDALIAAMFATLVKLVNSDDSKPDGGTKAKLARPKPTKPSGGVALQVGR